MEAWLRVNDGDVAVYEVKGPIPDNLDWDLPMYVGGALPNLFPGHFDTIGGEEAFRFVYYHRSFRF